MATAKGWHLIPGRSVNPVPSRATAAKPFNFPNLKTRIAFSLESFTHLRKRRQVLGFRTARPTTCFMGIGVSPAPAPAHPTMSISGGHLTSQNASRFMDSLVVADLDNATAKLAIGFLGPFLSGFAFLFILRIVMSWYPKLPVGKFPYVIAYAPTEPLLIPTRKLIPPVGGVDVTPVVWFGLISFLNEILLGPQGLLVLLSQQV